MDPINPLVDQQNPSMQPVEASIPAPKGPSSFFSFFKKPPFLIGVAVIVIAGLGTGGFLLAKQHINTAVTKIAPTSVPTPTPNPTANWKTYTDPNNQFSFKYPSTWGTFPLQGDNGNVLVATQEQVNKTREILKTFEGACGPFFPILIIEIPQQEYRDFLTNTVTGDDQTVTQQKVSVNGVQATAYDVQVKFKICNNSNRYTDVIIPSHGNYYKLEFVYVDSLDNTANKKIFDTLLTTFTINDIHSNMISPTQSTANPLPSISYVDKYFGYSLNYPKGWIFRRTYGPDMQKGAPTDILSGIDLTYNTGTGNNLMTQATIVVNMLDSHGLTDVQTWISQYDLNYPKNATKTHTTFNNLPAIQYGNFMESDHPTEYIYFISGKYMYRLMYWEDAGISDSIRAIVNSFAPEK